MSFRLLQNTEQFLVVYIDDNERVIDYLKLFYKPLKFHYPISSVELYIDVFVSSINDLSVVYRLLTHFLTTNENEYFTKTLFKKYLKLIIKLSTADVIKYKNDFMKKSKWPTEYWMDTVMIMNSKILDSYV